MSTGSLLIVGDPGDTQVGAHFLDAARELGLDVSLCDTRPAYEGDPITRRVVWWLGGHRPARLDAFSEVVWDQVRDVRPDTVLTTGLAPVNAAVLRRIGAAGIVRVNFLTDDPWNPAHRAPWFLRALPEYDEVFSPRTSTVADLQELGVRRIEPSSFAYNPRVHYRDPEGARDLSCPDVVVAGGADRERVTLIAPLLRAGVHVELYGGYWARFSQTRPYARGFLNAAGLRRVTAAARVSLGLIRRANRDDHAMRSFEIPAMGGCLVAERTGSHVKLFGPEGTSALFFDSPDELVDQVRWVLDRPDERVRLTTAAHARITGGAHTYRDRLAAMLGGVAT